MNCVACKVIKIGPLVAPYGGYLCSNNHFQCKECEAKANGQCLICGDDVNFVQMNFNSKPLDMQVPTAPPMDSKTNISCLDRSSSNTFPKTFLAEIEAQSNISEEHLSMHASNDSINAAKAAKTNKNLGEMPNQATQQSVADTGEVLFIGKNKQKLAGLSAKSNYNFQRSEQSRKHELVEQTNANKSCNQQDIENALADLDEILHTSELRFMDSTESLKNFCDMNENMEKPVKLDAKPEQAQQLFSAETLENFQSQNTTNSTELVENYLRSYGPLAICRFPAYACHHSCVRGLCNDWLPYQRQLAQMRSIRVSTESEPSLSKPTGQLNKIEACKRFIPKDYVVMQATGVPEIEMAECKISTKMAKNPSIDLRMQKVLETFQENPHAQRLHMHEQKQLSKNDENPKKIPCKMEIEPIEPTVAITDNCASVKDNCASVNTEPETHVSSRMSHSHRAFFNPTIECCTLCVEPKPQFQLIGCPNLPNEGVLYTKTMCAKSRALPASHLNMQRSPIKCPETNCQSMIFISDFSKHLIMDHIMLPTERIATGQCKNFFIDPRLAHNGASKCNLLYLIRDKITDLGSSKFKNLLPLLVMSSWIKLSELCNIKATTKHGHTLQSDVEFLMIWLTGIVPEEIPVSISLTVWSHARQVPTCHYVHSGAIYSIRESQEILDICQSGQVLLLSAKELQLLTNAGKNMLELQLIVY